MMMKTLLVAALVVGTAFAHGDRHKDKKDKNCNDKESKNVRAMKAWLAEMSAAAVDPTRLAAAAEYLDVENFEYQVQPGSLRSPQRTWAQYVAAYRQIFPVLYSRYEITYDRILEDEKNNAVIMLAHGEGALTNGKPYGQNYMAVYTFDKHHKMIRADEYVDSLFTAQFLDILTCSPVTPAPSA
eukprot:TRINITY_DN756_c0_g1_i1.p1 TRINITY_DN756_c0_g1~~TRINITY_DN756_c0_g1_i1.p1  ORF type:complete len:184 (+),score=86.11 TRINITY_DN756_c0_g1_i1:67-618(+)